MGFRFHAYDKDDKEVKVMKEWDDDVTGVYAAEYYGKDIYTDEIKKLYALFEKRKVYLSNPTHLWKLDIALDYMKELIVNDSIDSEEIGRVYQIFEKNKRCLSSKNSIEQLDNWLEYMKESIENNYMWKCY